MITNPRVKPHLSVEIVDAEHVFLLDEARTHILDGRVYPKLMPLLDGERATEDILDALSDQVSIQELFSALATLEQRGYIAEGSADRNDRGPVAAYWSRLDLSPHAVAARFAQTRVGVRAAGGADPALLAAALGTLGLYDSNGRDSASLDADTDADADVVMVATDDYLEPALAAINREALARRQPWMLVRLSGTMPWIGPIFRPGQTACWECLRVVLERNRHVESFVERYTASGLIRTAKAALPSSLGAAAALASNELARWLASGDATRERALLTFDLMTFELREHVVRRQPHCAACADAGAEQAIDRSSAPIVPAPIVLESRPKQFTLDGGHRTATPEATWERVRPLVSPITGVVTSLLRKDAHENGLTYSYATGHAFAVTGPDLAAVQQNMRYRSGGKGMSDLQARVSGVCEAIERDAGVWRGTEPVIRSTRRALGDAAIDLDDVLRFSAAQFAERQAWNAACSPTQFHVVPEPFDNDAEVDWAPLWSLTQQRTRYLPAAFCYYGHPDGPKRFCATDANGTAAGNTIEEAILQGLLELIERDAVAIWWYNRVPRPAIDLDHVDLPYVDALRRHYQSIGRELWVLDLTHDLGIPVFAGASRRVGAPTEDLVVSFGAHLDPVIALTRALTETNQFLPALSRTNADGTTAYLYADPDAIDWWKTATVANQPYVASSPDQPLRVLAEIASQASSDLKTDIEQLVSRLARHGLEVLVLDQTRADVGFPVAKVVVPGLRHFWRRLGPGRLYDVPVTLGWRAAPLGETELNPISMFF
jgi:bacteriocin biosynthesis cyclodehydratase domain-containing protein